MIKVTQHPYKNMSACCPASLFEKGTVNKGTARDAWSLDDFGYFGVFPVAWKYCIGHEAPMAVCNYEELWVKGEADFEKLPLKEDHYVLDLVTHYPYEPKHGLFFAVTKQHSCGQWLWFLNIFRRNGSWQLIHMIEGHDIGRPIQFWNDGDNLILQRSRSIALLDLERFTVSTLFESGEANITNSHLSTCGTRVGCVSVVGNDASSMRFHLINKDGSSTTAKEGTNPASKIDGMPIVLPLRVGNGMVEVEFHDA